jgi:hypothetical protein
MSLKHLMWVKESDIPKFRELGWRQAAQKTCHHGLYSTLMEWPFDGDPVFPKKEERVA